MVAKHPAVQAVERKMTRAAMMARGPSSRVAAAPAPKAQKGGGGKSAKGNFVGSSAKDRSDKGGGDY